MFSSFRSMRCLFPKATKPWQKALCGAMGTASLGTTIYGVWILERETVKNRLEKLNDRFNQRLDNPPTDNYEQSRLFNYDWDHSFIPGSVVVLGGSVGTMALSKWWYKDSYRFFQMIRGTTECCQIVRQTFLYSARTPIFGGALAIYLFITTFGFYDLRKQITNRQARKKNLKKSHEYDQ